MSRTLGVVDSVTISEDSNDRVHYVSLATIDADGANGQFGQRAAYMVGDEGSDYLANAGMKQLGGKVICYKNWSRDIVILGPDGEPKVFPGGIIASKTWYRHRDRPAGDPSAYVDSETVPYLVVNKTIVRHTAGVVRGSRARVSWNGKSIDCVVADIGPSGKIGEISIAAARALGINPSPRNGGLSSREVEYEIWPGQAADGYVLQPA